MDNEKKLREVHESKIYIHDGMVVTLLVGPTRSILNNKKKKENCGMAIIIIIIFFLKKIRRRKKDMKMNENLNIT